MLERVQFFANQLEQYRFDSQKALFAARESSKKKEIQLKEEIRTLRQRVEDLDWEQSQSKEKSRTLRRERDALNGQINDLKRQFARDIKDLETLYESEKSKVMKLEETNRGIREEAEKETIRRIEEVEKKNHEEQTILREKYAAQIAEIERQLLDMEVNLKSKSEHIHKLEAERMSLRALMSRSRDIVAKRARKNLKPLLRKESRSFTYL